MLHHSKGLERCYAMMLLSKTSTETLLSKNPKNPENNPETWFVNEKILITMTYYISLKKY